MGTYAVLLAVVIGGGSSEKSSAPPEIAAVFREAAHRYGLDERLLIAVARRESNFRHDAISHAGARGIMQLMPATAKWLGVSDPFDVRENIFAGARYLRMLQDMFEADVDLVLAAYNAGPGNVRRHGGIPEFRETQAYVRAIRAELNNAMGR